VVLLGVVIMYFITKKVGGSSARYFFRQQTALGQVEGFVEEIMNGQKVVKVFCHELESEADFDRLNDMLFEEAERANKYANTLGPILNNIGNVLYVIVAITGGFLLISGAPNVSLSGMPLSISIAVPFLNMTKQFVGNINQVSHQINAVVMGLAGTERIFDLMDQQPEPDDGYVTLVNAREEKGELTECRERTGIWAWRHPHQADGTVTYTRLTGDVRLFDVDFGYEEGKNVLHNISLYAKPGQKVAFVGATGAGKTTITNLLNRFYDIADGRSAMTALILIKSGKVIFVIHWGLCFRTPACLQEQLWKISVTDGWMPQMKSALTLPDWQELMILSPACRRDIRPSFPATEQIFLRVRRRAVVHCPRGQWLIRRL